MPVLLKRLIVLVAGALVGGACTQEAMTAPPAAMDVISEVLPSALGSEAGKITLTAIRGTTSCEMRVAFTGLYQDAEPTTADGNILLLSSASANYYQSPTMTASRRGTFRGSFTNHLTSSAWMNATVMRLGYWTGSSYGNFTRIADMAAGVLSNVNPDFTIVDRCH